MVEKSAYTDKLFRGASRFRDSAKQELEMNNLKGILILLVSMAAFLICKSQAHAQMPTVDLTNVTTLQSCPSGHGFYTADPNHPTTCSTATVSCANTAPIQITWSVTNAGGTQGTIVFFSGAGGTNGAAFPGEEQAFVPAFVSAGYQTVQTAWATDWEVTNSASTNYPFNIRNAACRPASFLQYV
jgi:hypothetical protein